MALNAYLRMKGQKSGEIKGSVTQKGRENSILVFAVEHSIQSPRDAASGLPTGKRMHHPIVITKPVDRSSPLLYQMLVTNENIATWELQFWRPSATGIEEQDYTVKLTNASIASINFHAPNTQDPTLAKFVDYEEIAFTYQKIQWTWVSGGITAQDDWATPA
jgi:type VI secretion system secreted protein Hcp